MWRVIWFFLGVTRLQVTGASPEWCLQRLAKARVPFHFCGKPDAFTAGIWILRRDEARVTRLVRAAGCECRVEERGGFPAIFGGLQRRLWLPTIPGQMVNTTGCGDAFMAALVWAYLEGSDLETTAKAGLAAGSIAMESSETINPNLSAQALKNRMQ